MILYSHALQRHVNAFYTDREKRKAETLAKEIFGRNRRQSAPAANGGIRKPGTGGSLASRIGPVKQQKPVLRVR